jgi:murein L,D-transpeptidase YafK
VVSVPAVRVTSVRSGITSQLQGGVGRSLPRAAQVALGLVLLAVWQAAMPAMAVEIEITGGGADRLLRQRAFARGALPLAGTPELDKLEERLAAQGLRLGDHVFMRIFKASSELELWMRKGEQFVLFATYPICQWSGVLGPKYYEGDNQSPEGVYRIARSQLKWRSRHHRAFDLGFPNAFDKAHGRSGSNILVHGGCSTEGCFAMTNPVIDEVFRLANAALTSGQKDFALHVYPFRMTEEELGRHQSSPWLAFWRDLKPGYDLFEQTRVPPSERICNGRYSFLHESASGSADCEQHASAEGDDEVAVGEQAGADAFRAVAESRLGRKLDALPARARRAQVGRRQPPSQPVPAASQAPEVHPGAAGRAMQQGAGLEEPSCDTVRASCRKHLALQASMRVIATVSRRAAAATGRSLAAARLQSRAAPARSLH